MNYICRTCLSTGQEEMESVYSIKCINNENVSIVNMIALCVGLEISKHDNFTNYICKPCTYILIEAFNYRKICWESHMCLLRQAAPQKITDKISDIMELKNHIKPELAEEVKNKLDDANTNITALSYIKSEPVESSESENTLVASDHTDATPSVMNCGDSNLTMNNFMLKTEKNKPTLLVDGFLFNRKQKHKNKTYWMCKDYRKKCCKARLHTNTENGKILKKIGEHSHAANASEIAVRRTIAELNEKAQSSNDNIKLLIAEYSTKLSDAVQPHMPSVSSLQRTIQRIRQSQAAIPKTLSELTILDKYKVTKDGKPFLLYDSGQTEHRILLFSTNNNLMFLCNSSDWCIGDSSKAIPPLFNKFCTIHGIQGNLSLPLVYALLPNQRIESYIALFEQLKILCPNLCPPYIMSYIDQTIVNAIQLCFPCTRQRFCLSQFAQTLYQKLCATGFKTNYDQDPEFAHKIRMLIALAFVPPDDVIKGFESLKQGKVIPDEINEVVDFFEEQYVGRFDNLTGRLAPTYAIQTWNLYDAVNMGLSKTNFEAVRWYNSFTRSVGANHRSLWCFLERLQSEQSRNEIILQQIIAGTFSQPKKRKYHDYDQRLKNIVSNYSTMDIVEFLRAAACSMAI